MKKFYLVKIGPIFVSSLLFYMKKYKEFLSISSSPGKNRPNSVSQSSKRHNQYCHFGHLRTLCFLLRTQFWKEQRFTKY